jgi:rhodanese-related sulfurtransferase
MSKLEQLTAPELAERLKREPAPVLVDVREPWEIQTATFPGAIAIPLGELVRRHEELDPEAETVLICHHGYRSMHACMFLANQEFSHLVNLRGGIDAWSALVDPSVPQY